MACPMQPHQARYTTMKTKIFQITGAVGFILALGSLSACFDESYYPASPGGYSYGSPYAYPQYTPQYYPEYVPPPRYYAYNPGSYWRNQEKLRHQDYVRDQEKLKHQAYVRNQEKLRHQERLEHD